MKRISKITFFMFCCILFIFSFFAESMAFGKTNPEYECIVNEIVSESSQKTEENLQNMSVRLVIPDVSDVRKNGYPQNEAGETYGPDIWDSNIEPDLLLVSNQNGEVGYVRQKDFEDEVNTIEEALVHQPRHYSVKMYLQDGTTVIGLFSIGAMEGIINEKEN